MNIPARRKNTPAPPPAPAPAEVGVDLTSPGESSSPELPHERDEATGMTGGVPSRRVQQGHADVKRGVQDTSRAPEADTAYRKLKK